MTINKNRKGTDMNCLKDKAEILIKSACILAMGIVMSTIQGFAMDPIGIMANEKFGLWVSNTYKDDSGKERTSTLILRLKDEYPMFELTEYVRDRYLKQDMEIWTRVNRMEGLLKEYPIRLSFDPRCDKLTVTMNGDKNQNKIHFFRFSEFQEIGKKQADQLHATAITDEQKGPWVAGETGSSANSMTIYELSFLDEDAFELISFAYDEQRPDNGWRVAFKFSGMASLDDGILKVEKIFQIPNGRTLMEWPIHTPWHEEGIKMRYDKECDRLTLIRALYDDKYSVIRFGR